MALMLVGNEKYVFAGYGLLMGREKEKHPKW
jgi:hypothetical protein